jgi:hypothetical protein
MNATRAFATMFEMMARSYLGLGRRAPPPPLFGNNANAERPFHQGRFAFPRRTHKQTMDSGTSRMLIGNYVRVHWPPPQYVSLGSRFHTPEKHALFTSTIRTPLGKHEKAEEKVCKAFDTNGGIKNNVRCDA